MSNVLCIMVYVNWGWKVKDKTTMDAPIYELIDFHNDHSLIKVLYKTSLMKQVIGNDTIYSYYHWSHHSPLKDKIDLLIKELL